MCVLLKQQIAGLVNDDKAVMLHKSHIVSHCGLINSTSQTLEVFSKIYKTAHAHLSLCARAYMSRSKNGRLAHSRTMMDVL